MKLFLKVVIFFRNGMRVFRKASSGNYDSESKAVKEIREEIYSVENSQETDSMRLKSDMLNISGDMRRGFNKVVLGNG